MATDPQARTTQLGYEKRDANPGGLFIFFVCMAVFLVLIGVVVAWLFGHYAKYDIAKPFTSAPFENARSLPPAPQLQAEPTADIQDYLQSQQKLLNSYAWVDRQQGIVRIPVDRAMELLSEKGFPVRVQDKAAAAPAGNGSTGSHSQNIPRDPAPDRSAHQHEVQP